MATSKVIDAVSETIRRSHCSHVNHNDAKHQCVGSCKITPTGIDLECTLCGSVEDSFRTGWDYKKLERMLGLIGIQVAYIGDYECKAMIQEMNRK